MSDKIKICDNCGAECDINASYCRKCSQPFPASSNSVSSPVVEGVEDKKLREFIGQKYEYYFKKFKKIPDDKFRIQFNGAALFFGPVWFIYRKMYKIAALYVAIVMLTSLVFGTGLPFIFKGTLTEFAAITQEMDEYQKSGKATYYEDPNTGESVIHPLYEPIKEKFDTYYTKFVIILLFSTFPPILLEFAIRLFANSIYKRHVLANYEYGEGGTSIGWAVAYWLFSDTIFSVLYFALDFLKAVFLP